MTHLLFLVEGVVDSLALYFVRDTPLSRGIAEECSDYMVALSSVDALLIDSGRLGKWFQG